MVGRCGLDSAVSGQGPVEGFCEHGDEYRDYISDY
jgi:hypothetical protein